MEFNKQAFTAEEQLNLLIKRGLNVKDFNSAVSILKRIGYYRLSSYMRSFQYGDEHNFREGTEFADLINLYNFDNELRHITFKAIEKIEIAYRAAISNVMCKKYGSHWFLDKNTFQKEENLEICKSIILKEIKKTDKEYAETFIAKYKEKYTEPELPPFWMIGETLTIGSLNKIFQLINWNDKREIISYLGFKDDIKKISSSNWLFSISVMRNICAHYSRLYNRVFRIAPAVLEKIVEFNEVPNNKYYFGAMIINYYLQTISSDYSLEKDLNDLFTKYPNISTTKMGFPVNWKKFSITRRDKQKIFSKG